MPQLVGVELDDRVELDLRDVVEVEVRRTLRRLGATKHVTPWTLTVTSINEWYFVDSLTCGCQPL